jgi:hypothetical protein
VLGRDLKIYERPSELAAYQASKLQVFLLPGQATASELVELVEINLAQICAISSTRQPGTWRLTRSGPQPLEITKKPLRGHGGCPPAVGSPPGSGLSPGDRRIAGLVGLLWLYGCYLAPTALAAPYAHQVGAGTAVVGVLMAADLPGAFLGGLLVARFPAATRSRLLVPLAVTTGLPLVATALVPPIPLAILLWAVSGALSSYMLLAQVAVTEAVPDSLRARTIGVASAGLQTAQGLGVLLAGAIAEVVPPSASIARRVTDRHESATGDDRVDTGVGIGVPAQLRGQQHTLATAAGNLRSGRDYLWSPAKRERWWRAVLLIYSTAFSTARSLRTLSSVGCCMSRKCWTTLLPGWTITAARYIAFRSSAVNGLCRKD